ncbi:1-aminocyclopropane-1-carboxylate deaminase/D-cysteine desulfhydrase [Chitinophaga lutea]|nr:pyridoxal-phosphate dependent enzyme [Chitinophaga lutea]
MLRLDRLHPVVSGNKWFKLKYNLLAATGRPVVTFGGAYSNHLVATAAACREQGIACTGVVRGEQPAVPGHTLQQAGEMGMQLVFVSRDDYRRLTQQGDASAVYRITGARDAYVIPEGGHNALGVKGCEEILPLAGGASFTHVICAVGTGTTLAGLINSATSQQVTGISVLKGAFSLNNSTAELIHPGNRTSWQLLHDFHEGGYGKISERLIGDMNDFYRQTTIQTDRVYTGKLVLAVRLLLAENFFPPGSRLLLIHSGGLQGNESLAPGVLCY